MVTLLAADSVTGFVHPDKIWRNVVGYRPPIVEGAGEILLNDLVVEGPMELIVPVANQDNARNGDFSFYFTISAPRLEPIKKQPVVVAR